ncbi:MAG: hypothetical protein C5B50_01000 [Verrucomicrobia bacterium]|nr:MAG: hypothetical protein C5B50_01000 [Verrucomicrobiota bacterium]
MRYNPLKSDPAGVPALPPNPKSAEIINQKSLTPVLTENEQRNGLELRFPGKPSDAIIARFRATKSGPREYEWRFHFRGKFWYAKRSEATRAFALEILALCSPSPVSPLPPTTAEIRPTTPAIVTPVPGSSLPSALSLPSPGPTPEPASEPEPDAFAAWSEDRQTLTWQHGGEIISFYRCPLSSPHADYFVAADGDAFGLECTTGQSCIALAEEALHLAGAHCVYVIFALKDRSANSISRWMKKWSARTLDTKGNIFDSVSRRVPAPAPPSASEEASNVIPVDFILTAPTSVTCAPPDVPSQSAIRNPQPAISPTPAWRARLLRSHIS